MGAKERLKAPNAASAAIGEGLEGVCSWGRSYSACLCVGGVLGLRFISAKVSLLCVQLHCQRPHTL